MDSDRQAEADRIFGPYITRARRELRPESGAKPDNAAVANRALALMTDADRKAFADIALANAADEVWDEMNARDDAAALAGKFPASQTVQVDDDRYISRRHMTAVSCQKRLDFIASDPDPRREKERRWLRARITKFVPSP